MVTDTGIRADARPAPRRTRKTLGNRMGPVLSDGTPLRDLIDFDRRRVSMRVLNDPEIHKLELSRIHARSWAGLGHVNEIPKAGDFVMRHVGQDPVIVARAQDGSVNVLLNVCSHRGMEICWANKGNQTTFKCPYHGWAFDPKGKLLGAPFEKEMYGNWNKADYGLRTARVELRGGLIFGTFSDSAPPLDEFLGSIGWYVNACETEDLVPVGTMTRTRVKANWKTTFEQLVGDNYHAAHLHNALMETGIIKGEYNDARMRGLDMVHVSSDLGHGIFCFNPREFSGGEIVRDTKKNDFYSWEGRSLSIAMFPQTTIMGRNLLKLPKGVVNMASIGGVRPINQETLEIWSVSLVSPDAAKFMSESSLTGSALGAVVGADDVEAWPSMQRSTNGALGLQAWLEYPALAGECRPDDWPGPGTVHAGFGKDDAQWEFWQHWYDVMTAEES